MGQAAAQGSVGRGAGHGHKGGHGLEISEGRWQLAEAFRLVLRFEPRGSATVR